MNKLLLTLLAFTAFTSCSSTKNSSVNNMVATMQVDEPIPGVCDNSRVIAILPLAGNGQIKAKAPLSEEAIEKRLNAIPFSEGKPRL